MTQTTTYKLNLIEMSDTFSPDPLNDNAQKTEQALQAAGSALAGEATARQAAIDAVNAAWQAALASETSARKSADSTESTARQSAITALDGRLKTQEAKKVVFGTYVGEAGMTRTITLGFTPKYVLLSSNLRDDCAFTILTQGVSLYTNNATHREIAKIVPNGFQLTRYVAGSGNTTVNLNEFDQPDRTYAYVACG